MFTIGEFSRLCHISARMLRHYDSIGLFHPNSSGFENGYRYYDSSQLSDIQKIEQLKQYDFTLEQIKQLLPLSDTELNEHYKLQLERLLAKKLHYETLIQQLETVISQKENLIMNNYHVITMMQKSQTVLTKKRTIHVCSKDFHQLSKDLYKELHDKGLCQTGPLQICYLDEEFNGDSATVELQIEVSGTGEGIRQLPECLSVTTIHLGSMETISHAYQAILSWLGEHDEYKICGPAVERLIKDESMAASKEELETAVFFPICLK